MRVLLITSNYPTELLGGAEIQTVTLAKGLMEYGYDVIFLAADTNAESKSYLEDLCVIKIPGKDKVGPVRHKEYLEKAILESRPDICYMRLFYELMWGIPFCKEHGIPIVSVSYSDKHVSPFPPRANLQQFINRLISTGVFQPIHNFRSIQFSNMHVCISKLIQDDIKRRHPNTPMQVIYNAHPVPPEEEMHKGYSKRVIWVNNIKPFKRVEIYIKLARYLPDIEFALVGRLGNAGRYNHHIRSLIQHGPSNLKYLGGVPLDRVNTEISKSDILFYTSTGEGFGNSFIQAWLRGVPTISLDYDPDGIIERERIGYCSHGFSQLVNNARELIDNPSMLCDMGQRARKYAINNHNYQRMISQYDELFRELYDRKLK